MPKDALDWLGYLIAVNIGLTIWMIGVLSEFKWVRRFGIAAGGAFGTLVYFKIR